MKVLNEYSTHHYIEEFERTQLFCPSCGQKEVWEEQSPGDYYNGPEFICERCQVSFTLQGPKPLSGNQLRKAEQLRTGITLKPSTPKGH